MLKKTPLYDLHVELGAKLVPFAGWEMPVQYPAGIMAEHGACREGAALFDVSHMCQLTIAGSDPAAAMEALCPGGLITLKPGAARYTQLTTLKGGIYDDLIVTNAGDHLFVVVNASMSEQDLEIMRAGLPDHTVSPLTDRALLAVQGPRAGDIVAGIFPQAAALRFMQSQMVGATRLSRLGYTGEDGFEISVPIEDAETLARNLIDAGAEPAGLGARDTLRMEAGLPLYGNDIDQTTSPIEAGLGFSIPKRRRDAADFPGADRIVAEASNGPGRSLVGLRPDGRAPARAGTEIAAPDGAVIGTVTSGGFSPTLQAPISLGYVPAEYAAPGTPLNFILRGKAAPARVVALPFVPHSYLR
ncbi:MAG: glycine cleavage system aminomethyltransferase GcvT [Dinoroseobacter sp.]|nr:glycine cleavage system aminomethyltransferase GcvT [Dinoroseobacter sp.]